MRDKPTAPFGLKLDTEKLSALEVNKGALMKTVGGKERVFHFLQLAEPVLINKGFCAREVFGTRVMP